MNENIHTEFSRMLGRDSKEAQTGQKGHVFWMYGLSGSGKSTLADRLERSLVERNRFVKLLDGDNVRSALNGDLGFSDGDRKENIRRIAEVAKLFVDAGFIVITSFICPKIENRLLAESIIGTEDISKVYIEASYKTCSERDVKGLYAKAKSGDIKQFTGKDSDFEPPLSEDSDWIINTEDSTIDTCVEVLLNKILPMTERKH